MGLLLVQRIVALRIGQRRGRAGLALPFQVRPDVRIPSGAYNMDEFRFSYNISPGRQTGLPPDVFQQKDRQLVVKLNCLVQK